MTIALTALHGYLTTAFGVKPGLGFVILTLYVIFYELNIKFSS